MPKFGESSFCRAFNALFLPIPEHDATVSHPDRACSGRRSSGSMLWFVLVLRTVFLMLLNFLSIEGPFMYS